jgi:cyclopropane fatty-acyl-phospholipid synthase-like methyltransferase
VTLSRPQYEFCMDRVNTEGLQGNVRILFQDYRELEGEAAMIRLRRGDV